MKLTYYWWSPRGFTNESTVFAANMADKDERKFIESLRDINASDPDARFCRISRKEAYATVAHWRRDRYETIKGPCEITRVKYYLADYPPPSYE